MKKLLLTLGTATAIAAPVASVVACGSNQSENAKVMTEKDFWNYMYKHSSDLKMITKYQDQNVLSVRTLAEVNLDLFESAVKEHLNDDAKVYILANISKEELLKAVKSPSENGAQIIKDKYKDLIQGVKEELKRDSVSKYHFAMPIVEGWEGIFVKCNGFIFEDISFKDYDDKQKLYDFIEKNV